jgi:hypothetical protein
MSELQQWKSKWPNKSIAKHMLIVTSFAI